MQQTAAEALHIGRHRRRPVGENEAGALGKMAGEARFGAGGRIGDMAVDRCCARSERNVLGNVTQERGAEFRGLRRLQRRAQAGLRPPGLRRLRHDTHRTDTVAIHHSDATEPVVAAIGPIAARLLVGDIDRGDELRILEAKLGRDADLEWIAVLRRQDLI